MRSTAWLTVISFVASMGGSIATAPNALAQAQAGQTVDPCSQKQFDSDALEQCNGRTILITSAALMGAEMLEYAIAAIVCAKACGLQADSQRADGVLGKLAEDVVQSTLKLDKAAAATKENCTALSEHAEGMYTAAPTFYPAVPGAQMGADQLQVKSAMAACSITDTTKCNATCDNPDALVGCHAECLSPGEAACAVFRVHATSNLATSAATVTAMDTVSKTNQPALTKACTTLATDVGQADELSVTIQNQVKAIAAAIIPAEGAYSAAKTTASGQGGELTGKLTGDDYTSLTGSATAEVASGNTLQSAAGVGLIVTGSSLSGTLVGSGNTAQAAAACIQCASSATQLNKDFLGIAPRAGKFTADALRFQGQVQGGLNAALLDHKKAIGLYAAGFPDAMRARAMREESAATCKMWDRIAFWTDVGAAVTVITTTAILDAQLGAGTDMGQVMQYGGQQGIGVVMDFVADQIFAQKPTDPNDISCTGIWKTMAMQSAVRGLNMGQTIYQAVQASKYQLSQAVGGPEGTSTQSSGLTATNPTPVSGGTPGSGGSSSGSGFHHDALPGLLKKLPANVATAVNPSNAMSSNATAAELAPKLLNAFAPGTTPQSLSNDIMNGKSPLAAIAAAVGDPATGSYLSAMDANMAKLTADPELNAALAKQFPPNPNANQNVAGFDGGGSHSYGSSGPSTPDMSSLLAGLMPKKPGGPSAASAAPTDLGVATAARAPAAASTGIHPPDVSLFDIVGQRYQIIATKFLAGEDLPGDSVPADGSVAPSSTLVPKNIYLKH